MVSHKLVDFDPILQGKKIGPQTSAVVLAAVVEFPDHIGFGVYVISISSSLLILLGYLVL